MTLTDTVVGERYNVGDRFIDVRTPERYVTVTEDKRLRWYSGECSVLPLSHFEECAERGLYSIERVRPVYHFDDSLFEV